MELNSEELALISATGVSLALVQELRNAGGRLERLTGDDAHARRAELPGVMSLVPVRQSESVLLRLRREAPADHFVFLCGLDIQAGSRGLFGMAKRVAIVRGMGPFEVLAAMRTNGANYDISTELVIAKLREWDSRYGLDIQDIDADSVAFGFHRKPGNLVQFAREVYELCPDTVEQGPGTLEELAIEIDRANAVRLWWD